MRHAKIFDFIFMKFCELLIHRWITVFSTAASVIFSDKENRISGMKKFEGTMTMPLCDNLMCFEKIKGKTNVRVTPDEEYCDIILAPALNIRLAKMRQLYTNV
jgi:hypothetical protein